ncbi:MAG: hypothetical protein H7Y20_01110 [Bryobacteraceae bacterium]|nr:hypothetical protein [Bryobacteraceae bacterium]
MDRTATGGEVSVLDPGDFGPVTISKGLTINGGNLLAGVSADLTNGITVNAPATDTVILRGLHVTGHGSGLNGIRYLSGKMLVVEDCRIGSFTQNGIDVALNGPGKLSVIRTSVTGGANGIRIFSTGGRVTAMLSAVSVRNAGTGIDTVYGSTHLSKSVISGNSNFGIYAEGGTLNVEDVVLMGNSVAAQSQQGATLRVANSELYENMTGFGCGGGIIATLGNNRKGGNVAGVVAVCAPNSVIATQ